MFSEANLPDDIEALKALVLATQQEARDFEQKVLASQTRLKDAQSDLANKDRQIVRLEKLISDLQRARFGAKSEKANADQLDLTFEDIEVAIEATQAEIDANGTNTDDSAALDKSQKPVRKANRGHLPRHFERVEVVIEPEEGTTCPCGNACHVIGEDTSERLEIIPAQFRVIVTKRPKYACRACDAGILQAPAPKHIVSGGIPTESTLAHVIVSKYADHLPLYRQAQIYGRQGLDLDRSTLTGWIGKASYYLQPVYEHLLADLKASNKLLMDETPAPVLAPGKKKVHKGYFWALARNDQPWGGDDPPGVAFTYSSGRSGAYAEEILKDFNGTLQVDGYSGYNRLQTRSQQPIKLAYCWAHARRKLFDVHKSNQSEIAADGIKQIARLYQIETEIRGMTPAERLSVREQSSKPLIHAFRSWLETRWLVSLERHYWVKRYAISTGTWMDWRCS